MKIKISKSQWENIGRIAGWDMQSYNKHFDQIYDTVIEKLNKENLQDKNIIQNIIQDILFLKYLKNGIINRAKE